MSVVENENKAVLPTSQNDKQKVAILKEVSSILKTVYRNPKAYYEVNAAIFSGYYADERVLLKDLLFPQSSSLYKTENFRNYHSPVGEFKREFLEVFNSGSYPNLTAALGISSSGSYRTTATVPADTAREIFSNSAGVSIYFPYSQNFGANFSPSYFDNINTDPFGDFATIVAADREADAGPGQEPYRKKSYDANGDIVWSVAFRTVTVNDDYADLHPTHIVGVGGHTARIFRDPPPPSANVNRVYMGWVRLTKQYDKLISFNSANGGGSEVKLCRISGYLQFQNQQVTNFSGDQVAVDIKRRDINRKNWQRTYSVWDEDWVTANNEQILAVYEEDAEGTETFSGSLNTTLRVDSSTTTTGSIGYNVIYKSQDDLILQTKYSRSGYFGAAKTSQGCGFQMCDGRTGYCRYDTEFLPSGQNWPIYNCGANLSFTWPYNTY